MKLEHSSRNIAGNTLLSERYIVNSNRTNLGQSSKIFYNSNILIGVLGLILVFIYGIMPNNIPMLVPLYLILFIISFNYPHFALYYIITIVTMKSFFVIPPSYYGGDILFRFAHLDDAAIKYADELAFLLCFQNIIMISVIQKRTPSLLRKLGVLKWFKGFIVIIILSALVNSVPTSQILKYILNWTRPFLVYFLIFYLPWDEDKLNKIANYLITLAFVFQWGGSIAVNFKKMLKGDFFWVDDFTGTFTFPACEHAAFLLTIVLFVFLGKYFTHKNNKFLVVAVFAFFGIISAQVGTMTVMLLFVISVFFSVLVLFPHKFGLSSFKGRFTILVGFVSIFFIGLFVWLDYDNPRYRSVVGYSQKKFEQRVLFSSQFSEIPKILSYYNLGQAYISGEINPLLGAGPANYLTGLGKSISSSPLIEKYGSKSLYKVVGQAESQQNSVVGLAGEIGLIGFIVYISLVFSIFRHLWHNKNYFYKSEWHGLFIGTIGSFIFYLFYASIQNAFETPVHGVYIFSLSGIFIIKAYITKNKEIYIPFRS